MTGYFHWQVTDDSGSDALNTNVHDQVYAIGPEVSVFGPLTNIVFSLRSQWEFEAERSIGRQRDNADINKNILNALN